jgi:hypothetical protein
VGGARRKASGGFGGGRGEETSSPAATRRGSIKGVGRVDQWRASETLEAVGNSQQAIEPLSIFLFHSLSLRLSFFHTFFFRALFFSIVVACVLIMSINLFYKVNKII